MCLGFLTQYALVLVPLAAAASAPAGGALVGSGFAFVSLVVAGWFSAFQPGPFISHLAAGALVAIIPAAYTGSSLVVYAELGAAKVRTGREGGGAGEEGEAWVSRAHSC